MATCVAGWCLQAAISPGQCRGHYTKPRPVDRHEHDACSPPLPSSTATVVAMASPSPHSAVRTSPNQSVPARIPAGSGPERSTVRHPRPTNNYVWQAQAVEDSRWFEIICCVRIDRNLRPNPNERALKLLHRDVRGVCVVGNPFPIREGGRVEAVCALLAVSPRDLWWCV